MTNVIFTGSDPDQWTGAGAELGYLVGGINTFIKPYLGTSAQEELFTALDGDGSDLNAGSSPVKSAINKLINTQGLTGLGIGKETNQQTNQTLSNNSEIQSEVGIGNADQFFIDFNRLTRTINVELGLFFSDERVTWNYDNQVTDSDFVVNLEDPTLDSILSERMRYQLLKEVATGGDVVVGTKQYDIIQGWTYETSVGTGTWGNNNAAIYNFQILTNTDVDAMILSGADYNPATDADVIDYAEQNNLTLDTSDFLLSQIEVTDSGSTPASAPETFCFGGNDILANWGGVNFAYQILGGTLTQVGNTSVIDPIENNNTDLGAINNLPTGATGLGVGTAAGPNSNDPVPNNPEIQGNPAQIEKDDVLRMDFSQAGDGGITPDTDGETGIVAFKAEVDLSLFYENEIVRRNPQEIFPERMKYQLLWKDGTGAFTNVGGVVTETSNNGEAYSGANAQDNAGEYSFTVESDTAFNAIKFLGENYGGGYVYQVGDGDVSDYLVKKVCLTGYDGDGATTLTATANPDNFVYNSIGDAGDYITGFNPAQDVISINKGEFGLGTNPAFSAILGSTPLNNAAVSQYFSYSGGTLSFTFDFPSDSTPDPVTVPIATLAGAPALTNLFFF